MTVRRVLVAVALRFAIIAIAGIAAGRLVTGPFDNFVARDIDTPIRNCVTRQNDPMWHHLFAHISAFGTAFVTGTVALLAGGLWSLRTRKPTFALKCATAFAGAGLLTIIVKFGVGRDPASGPRPAFTAGSFPSGHALFAISVYGTIATLAFRSNHPRMIRASAATLLFALVLAVGWSRVFLLDHYASDVVGSLVLGAAWIVVVVGVVDLPRAESTGRATSGDRENAHLRALSRNPSI